MKKICILFLFLISGLSAQAQNFNYAFADDTLVNFVNTLNIGDTILTAWVQNSGVILEMIESNGQAIHEIKVTAQGGYISSVDLAMLPSGELVLAYHSLNGCDTYYPQFEVYQKYDKSLNLQKEMVITSGQTAPVVDSSIFVDKLSVRGSDLVASGNYGFRIMDGELSIITDSVFQAAVSVTRIGADELFWRENPSGSNPVEKIFNLQTFAVSNPSASLVGGVYELNDTSFLQGTAQQINIRRSSDFQILHTLSLPTNAGLQPNLTFTSGDEIILMTDTLYEVYSANDLSLKAQGVFNIQYSPIGQYTDATTFNGYLRVQGRVTPQHSVLQVFDYSASPAPAFSRISQKLMPLGQRVDNVVQASSSLYRLIISSDWRAVLTNQGNDTIKNLAAIIPFPGSNPGAFCFPNWEVRKWSSLNLAPGDSVVFNFTNAEKVMSNDSTTATASASLHTIMANDNIVETSGTSQFTQNFTVGKKDYISQERIQVFPNPVYEFINIELANASKSSEVTIEIFDATGRSFLHQSHSDFSSNVKLNLKHLPPGVYWLHLEPEGNATQVISIVKR